LNLWKSIANYLVKSQENKPLTTISPSMIGHCARQNAMSMLQYPVCHDAQTLSIFDMGESVHIRYQGYLSRAGLLVAKEVPLNEDSPNRWTAEQCRLLRIRGRLDAIIRFKEKVWVVELKSAKKESFQRMIEEGPYDAYIDQLMLYLYLTSISDGIIFIENKNTQETHEFYFTRDDERIKKIIEKINMINHYVVNLKLPPREHKPTDFECRYLCSYTNVCWSKDPEAHIRKNKKWLRQLIEEQTPGWKGVA